jgi:DNA-binding NtrC family response regulator
MNSQQVSQEENGQKADSVNGTGEIALESNLGPWVIEHVDPSKSHRQVFLRRGERLTIGTRQDSDLILDDSWVSGLHCVLDASNGSLELIDMNSKNGVFVGNARVKRARLDFLSTTFTVGKTSLIVKVTSRRDAVHPVAAISGLIGRSEPMVRLTADIRRLAKLRAPVLIVGESGVGKDVVARALHGLSGRKGNYVPLNVATIPENLADSELFGHRRGAFTGAVQQRVGAFEQAHEGTLFLDEIGELAASVQAKLLRVLEDGMVRPVGATQSRQVNSRVVSATCAPLSERCAVGQFRFDLLQRLSMVVLEVPPLRDRRSDIVLLAQGWLERFRSEVGPRYLAEDAVLRLTQYDWPGNVRELGSVLYRACVGTDQNHLDAMAIERAIKSQVGGTTKRRFDPREFLTLAEGNVSLAARLAGLPRTSFRHWLARSAKTHSSGNA